MMKLFFGLLFVSQIAAAGECFELTYCSTGEAPRYIFCSRGQDCSKAKDHGLQFKADCTVSRWLGDALMTQKYQISGKTLKVEKEAYELSADGQSIVALNNRQHVFATKACKAAN